MTACCPIGGLGYRCQCADPSTPAEVPFCDCSKGQRVSVRLTILPRPVPLFGEAVELSACPSCYSEKRQRGFVLSQRTIGTAVQGSDSE
jgi:hypothetical protein